MKTKRKFSFASLICYALLGALAIIWIYPFFWMIASSFKTQNEFFKNRLSLIPETFSLENFRRTWELANFDVYFLNTVIVTVSVVALVLVMSCMAGYVLGRYRFFGKNVMLMVFVCSIMIPLVTTVIPTYEIVKSLGLIGTRTGLILAQAGGAHVVFLLLFSGFFQQIPKELEEAATVDGCGFFRTFISIMVPLAKPVSVTVIIMQTIWTWNAFLLPLVLTLSKASSRTLAVGLYAFRGENTVDWTGITAGGVIAIMPIIILFLFMQRHFVEGVAGAVKA